MSKNKKRPAPKSQTEILSSDILLDPEQRLCPLFDSTSINRSGIKKRSKMGVSVLDNCPEEHIM